MKGRRPKERLDVPVLPCASWPSPASGFVRTWRVFVRAGCVSYLHVVPKRQF
jgi:hypothetical protein